MNQEQTHKDMSEGVVIRNVSKMFYPNDAEPIEALKPVDLTIAPSEFVALIGPSGCGKSTLLNIIAGFDTATAGSVLVFGEKVVKPDIKRGMVFQQYALFPWLNIRDNIAFGLRQQGMPRAEREKIANDYLDLVGLTGFGDAKPAALSGGMKQRVALARAFATNPSTILMDEPFGALDALTRSFLQQELLRIWREHRKTVVLVTHSVQEALFLATRVIVMTSRPGRVKLDLRIELDYPRSITDPRLRDLEAVLLDALHDELRKTYGSAPAVLVSD